MDRKRSIQVTLERGDQVPRSRVGELTAHWIQDSSKKNASLKTNVHKHCGLIPVNSGVQHIHDTYRGRRRGQRLQTNRL